MIYKLEYDYKDCYLFKPDLDDLAIKMPSYSQRFRAKPRLDNWVAPKALFFASENYEGQSEKLPDITTWAIGNLALNPNAHQVCKDLLESSGEFLPLIIDDEKYYMFNTLFVIPETGIDYSESVDMIDSGVHIGQKNARFILPELGKNIIFKAPTNKLTYSFATQKFVDIYHEHKLNGLQFERVQ